MSVAGGLLTMLDRLNAIIDLKAAANAHLTKAKKHKHLFDGDPINWADLSCVSADWVLSDNGQVYFQICVEECAPDSSKLREYLYEKLLPEYGPVAISLEW